MTGSTYHITMPEGPAVVALGTGHLRGKTCPRPNPLLMPAQASAASYIHAFRMYTLAGDKGAHRWMEPKGLRRRDEQKLHCLSCLLTQHPFISLSSP